MSKNPLRARYLITIQRPLRWLTAFAGIIALVALMVWVSYEQGSRMAGFDTAEADRVIGSMQAEIETLKSELAETQRQAAMLERNSRIEDDTSGQLKKSLTEAQNEVLELKKELAFYKSIVAPEQGKPTIVIQTIQLKKDVAGDYDYKIMVSQQGQNDRFARGTLEVNIEGTKQGKKQVLALDTVSDDAAKPMNFGFKYFQDFTGKLKLPKGFKAVSMRVKLNPRTKTLEAVDETFPWDDLTAGD
jgi:hypothetical protein